MKKLLKEQRGETLVETLVAVLIVSLSVLFLTTAAMSAARVNKNSAETDTAFHRAERSEETVAVTVKRGSATIFKGTADLYVTGQDTESEKDDYRYYRLRPEEGR